MKIDKIKTHKILAGELLLDVIKQYLPEIPDKSILVITSKIMSICQSRIIPKNKIQDKSMLIQEEADFYLEGSYSEKYGIWLTIKNGILIPTAGIDESNGNENYILYPINIAAELEYIWNYLKTKHQIKHFGVLLTDSHTTPLRRGVTGIALGWCGFQPLHNYIGAPDIFGHPLRVTQLNIVDALASAAVLVMGEGNEQTPLAVITASEKIIFQDRAPTEDELKSVSISIEDDIYAPLISSVEWQSKNKKENDNE